MRKKISNLTTMRIIGMSMLILTLAPKSVYAYEPDTHYQLTYVMCRAVGLNHNDALIVAQFDQGMDDSDGTLANHGPQNTTAQPREEGLWHALPSLPYAYPKTLLERKEDLFLRAIGMPDRLRKLQYLGVFFHYQQDTWAHRKHPNAHPTFFDTYAQPFGHAAEIHQPDRPPFDPECALRCLEEGIVYLQRFIIKGLGETPSALLKDYSAAEGKLDSSWPGKGMYINQILIDKSNTAREFTTSLIRTQIDAYTNGLDANPRWVGHYTSSEAVYAKVRENFQNVCAQFKVPVQIPAKFVPLSYLTTDMILNGGTLAYEEKFITIRSSKNKEFICATDGLKYNQWLYCKKGTPVTFVVEGPLNNCNLKVNGQFLYFSYNETTGAVKLWNAAEGAKFSLEKQANGNYAIKSLKYNQYVWLSGESPYITTAGSPNNAEGQWIISGLEPEVVIYNGENYSGDSKKLTLGSYEGIKDFANDEIKSIQVNGYKVTLFENGPTADPKLSITSDKPTLGSFNNKTSNILVEDMPPAIIYYGENYGEGSKELKVGSYQGISDFDNDAIQSIKVKNGYRVTLFQDGLNTDPNLLSISDKPSLGDFNQKTSNILVEADPKVAVEELAEKTITIRSYKTKEFICATDGLKHNQWLYCKKGTPVTFVVEGPLNNCNLRVKGEGLYFSYTESTGAVKLWNAEEGAKFSLERQANGNYAIKSNRYNQYVWLSDESPYITKAGRADNAEGQWIISGLESNTLKAGENLNTGQRIISANGQYHLVMQDFDGHLCIYKTADNGFVWGSMAYGFQGASLKMQTDGNLVVYDGSNAAKWSSKTHPAFDTKFNDPANVPVKVVLENTGKLVLYNAAGSAMWSSK